MNKLLAAVFSFFLFSFIAQSQIVVSGAGSASNTYSSLSNNSGVFQALNNSVLTGADITITIVGNSTSEAGTVPLYAGAWNSITIVPEGVRTISGSVDNSIIRLSGADFVTIDGLNDGINSLTISNLSNATSISMCAINIVNDAVNNTIQNCYLESGSKAATLIFGNGTTTGNDNNTIENCDFGPAGSNNPVVAISSTSATAAHNSNNTISNCTIHDIMPYSSFACKGINIGNGNSEWTVVNNHIFNSPANNPDSDWYGIYATSTTAQGLNISGNTIGFSSFDMTGTFTCTHGFYGIVVLTATDGEIPNTINNNIISNVNQSGSGLFVGIQHIPQFGTNDAEINNNTISNIYTSTSDKVIGITTDYLYTSSNDFGSDNLVMTGNTISNITRTQTDEFAAIRLGMANTADVSYNTIANLFLDEIQGSGDIRGIYQANDIGSLTMNNNDISGLTTNSTSVIVVLGIKILGSTGSGTYEYSNNIIHDFSGIGGSSVYGIHCNSDVGQTSTKFHNNEVFGLTAGNNVGGIYLLVGTDSLIVSSNRIYNLTSITTQNNKTVIGLDVFNTTNAANYVFNNSISGLYSPQGSNPNGIIGLNIAGYTSHLYYNTVYLDAQSSGAIFGIQCLKVQGSATLDLRNNVLINKSTPGSDISNTATNGVASCIYFPSTIVGSPVNYASTSDNNVFYCAGEVGSNNHKIFIAVNGSTTTASASTLAELLSLSYNSDSESHVEDVTFISTTPGDIDYLRPDLSIPTWVESGAQEVDIISLDINNESRFGDVGYIGAGTAPDAGCYEFAGIRPESSIVGCTDPEACNFNPEAAEDDGTCEYPAQYYLNCDGSCLTDSDADGVCDEIEIYGCTDPDACNYNEAVTENDGSCSYMFDITITGEYYLLYESYATYTIPLTEGSTYDWTIAAGEILTGQGSPSVDVYWPTGTTPAQICVQETNAAGCVGQVFCLDVMLYVIGIAEQVNSTLLLYPNPAIETISLKNAENHIGEKYVILNGQGQTVIEGQVYSTNQAIDIQNLASGIYILTLPENSDSLVFIKH